MLMTSVFSKVIDPIRRIGSFSSHYGPHVACFAFYLLLDLDGGFINEDVATEDNFFFHAIVKGFESHAAADHPLGEELAADFDAMSF